MLIRYWVHDCWMYACTSSGLALILSVASCTVFARSSNDSYASFRTTLRGSGTQHAYFASRRSERVALARDAIRNLERARQRYLVVPHDDALVECPQVSDDAHDPVPDVLGVDEQVRPKIVFDMAITWGESLAREGIGR